MKIAQAWDCQVFFICSNKREIIFFFVFVSHFSKNLVLPKKCLTGLNPYFTHMSKFEVFPSTMPGATSQQGWNDSKEVKYSSRDIDYDDMVMMNMMINSD